MASNPDRKDEFRKYLERNKVLEVLTRTLTDLFELETRPEDPLQYLHAKFGEHVKKDAPPVAPPKTMSEAASTNKDMAAPPTKPDVAPAKPHPSAEPVSAQE